MQWLRMILPILCLSMMGGYTEAREVIAVGSAGIYGGNVGGARRQALRNAQRQAVEQGVGAFIDSNTISRNFEIIKDEILSSSKGYVERYEIVEEGRTEDGLSYEVKIRANVSDAKIKDKLSVLRILHKKMGNKRLMIVYSKKDPNALPRKNGAVTETLQTIRSEFNKMGFRVFNEQVMNRVYQAIEKAALVDRPEDNLVAMALDQHAEILVTFEMIGGKRGQRGGQFYAAKAIVRLGVYDASTGRQIADVITRDKELSLSPPGPYDWYEKLGKAGKRAGSKAARQAIEQITNFYQNVGDLGFAYLIVFRNYTIDQEDEVLDYLENTPGFKQLTELKNSQNYLEIELFSSESKSRLRRKIRRDLKNKGIKLVTQDAVGNRLTFVNPDAEVKNTESLDLN